MAPSRRCCCRASSAPARRHRPPPMGPSPLDRMQRALSNEPGLISDVLRPQPVFADGKLHGYRVYPGRDARAFAALGLRNGDLVLAINGTALDDPARGNDIFSTLGNSDQARVTVMRNGQQQDITLNMAQTASQAEQMSNGQQRPALGRCRIGPECRAAARPGADRTQSPGAPRLCGTATSLDVRRLKLQGTFLMTFSYSVTSVLARVLAGSLAGGAFLMVAAAPALSPGVALAQAPGAAPSAARNPQRRQFPGPGQNTGDEARITLNFKDADIRADCRGGGHGHPQDLHHRPAGARAGDDAVIDAGHPRDVLSDLPVHPAGARLHRGARRGRLHQDRPGRQPALLSRCG